MRAGGHEGGEDTQVRALKMTFMGRRAVLTVLLVIACLACVLAPSARASASFGIESFTASLTANEGGLPTTIAGSHPYAFTTKIMFNHEGFGFTLKTYGDPKNVEVSLPPGVVINPRATTTRCTEGELEQLACPASSAVGVATAYLVFPAEGREAVYNMVPPPGAPAELAFDGGGVGVFVHIVGRVRTGGDYGLSGVTANLEQQNRIGGFSLTLWGDPGNASHNSERGACAGRTTTEKAAEKEAWEEAVKENPNQEGANEDEWLFNCPAERTNTPFVTAPGTCSGEELMSTVTADSWQEPENELVGNAFSAAVTDCEVLHFSPSLAVTPTEPASAAESPSGLNVDLRLPQEESLTGLAESDMKEAVVKLPAGMTVSPSAANGLGACTLEQIGLGNANAPSCPDSSKLGTVEIETPLLEKPLKGSVFVAQQGNLAGNGSNPFGSLLALYLVAEGQGALIKLPGKIELDATTGQLTARFGEDPLTKQFLPELPFSDLKMSFFGGPRAPLITPSSCGTYTTTSQLTSWDGNPPAEPSSEFTVGQGCSAQGFAPSFSAGTADPQAGGYSAFSLTFSRQDGEQRLGGVQVTMPPGLLGRIAGVTQCPEPQASKGECGQGSLLGEATTAVGAGPDPYWVKGGKVYLTGPYNGGPFGLSIVVPTTAGPFTLTGNGGPGREIVRASIRVNPNTAQITVVSDPLPTILEGIPLDIRTVNVTVNRSGFMFNPTNCESLSVVGTITSTTAASAGVVNPFEAANCAALPFKPSFTASTQGQTSRANGASLVVKVAQKAGEANIHRVDLQLPIALPSRLTTLQKACIEAQFNTDPAGCPAASVIGTAIAHTPVLNAPLSGPAYLVSHGGAAFPDVEFILQGEGVAIVLDGKTQIKNGITYSHFETVPDAPISSFETNLPEGSHSVLAAYLPANANGSFCGLSLTMRTTIEGQNGAQVKQTTGIVVTGCKPAIEVVTKKRSGGQVLLTLRSTVAGTLTITGRGVKKTKLTVAAGEHQVKVPLTSAGKRSRKIKLKIVLESGKSTLTKTVKL